jgi:exopolysaccharide biosynthesis predicted pyruvyltransferase EpsI
MFDFQQHEITRSTARLTPRGAAILAEPFDDLACALKSAASGKKIVFLQNSGNFGDALIRYGTLKFFEDQNISYREYDMGSRDHRNKALADAALSRLSNSKLFVYGGSGAWADVCGIGRKYSMRQFKVNPSLLIFPTTYQHYGPPSKIPAFARDKGESARTVPHAKFCHDMAFYLALIDADRVLPNRTPPTKPLGLMFRTDNEARDHGFANLPGNYDLSAAGYHWSDPQEFLRHIDQYETILTDRLHCAIGASILGKNVFIVPGNYFKIRDIFNASIDSVFENCTLVTDAQAAEIARRHDARAELV